MARQKAIVIQGATPGEVKTNLDNWLALTVPEPVVNTLTADLANNRILIIYKDKIE